MIFCSLYSVCKKQAKINTNFMKMYWQIYWIKIPYSHLFGCLSKPFTHLWAVSKVCELCEFLISRKEAKHSCIILQHFEYFSLFFFIVYTFFKFKMSKQKLRVLFARNPPDAFDDCHEFPTLKPYMQCPFPGWCIEVKNRYVW